MANKINGVMVAGVASVVAGFLHYATAAVHLPGEILAAALFSLLGGFQIVWPALLSANRTWPWVVGGVVNVAAIGVWAVSRTSGIPFGHHAGEMQPVGLLDGMSVVAELVVIVVALVTLRSNAPSTAQAAGR